MKRQIIYPWLLLGAVWVSAQPPGIDLSASESANCYVVTAPGTYSFDATLQGGISRPTGIGMKAEILWSDAPDVVRDVELGTDGRIVFSVGERCGNVVVALMDNIGTVRWSWHIWYPADPLSDEIYTSATGMLYVVQDRPLGALRADGKSPLFYQWGRKDPFPPTSDVYAGGIEQVDFLKHWSPVPAPVSPDSTVQIPTIFITGENWCAAERSRLHTLWGDPAGYMPVYRTGGGWSDEKSPYDPCPAGYRVANSNTFSGFTSTGQGSSKPSEWNVMGPWQDGWQMMRTPLDQEGTFYSVTGWRDGATGTIAGGSRVVAWCSNPSERGSDQMRRIFFHEKILLTTSREHTAMAYSVRCVREDDSSIAFTARESAADSIPRDFEDLSAEGTANCYIVTHPGNYRFCGTVRGNSKRSVGKWASADLLWSDRPGLVRSVTIDKEGYICFSTYRNLGNAVLAIRDSSGEILWSWHIWCAGERPADESIQNHDGTGYAVMDRNLGAFSSSPGEASCMLYQWGRKDPFPYEQRVYTGDDAADPVVFLEHWPPVDCYQTGDDRRHNNQEYVLRNPATFIMGDEHSGNWFPYEEEALRYLWGDPQGYAVQYRNGGWSDAKSIYDPCPAGYRVANVNTFSGLTTTGRGAENPEEFRTLGVWQQGWYFRRFPNDDQGMWFPVTGWRDRRTGNPGGGTRGALWCSNTTGSAGTEWRRIFFHKEVVLVASKEGAAQAYGVRCVRE